MEMLPNYLMTTEDDNANIYETSFVEEPATGFSFLKFSKGEIQVKTLDFKKIETTQFKRMVSGVWFMPDTKYLRYDQNRGLYTVEFKREALKEALIKYLKNDLSNNTKVEHNGEYLDGFVSVEHWIYDENNQLSPVFNHSLEDLGYDKSQIKPGTVFKTVYISDEQFWNEEVMPGNVKGFSIGGLFSLEEEVLVGTQTFNAEGQTEVVTEVVSETPAVQSEDVSLRGEIEVSSNNTEVEAIVEPVAEVTEVAETVETVDQEAKTNELDIDTLIETKMQEKIISLQEKMSKEFEEKQNVYNRDLQDSQSKIQQLQDQLQSIQKENESLKQAKRETPITSTTSSTHSSPSALSYTNRYGIKIPLQ